MRDLILNVPAFWVQDPGFVSACLVTAVSMHFVAPLVESRYRTLLCSRIVEGNCGEPKFRQLEPHQRLAGSIRRPPSCCVAACSRRRSPLSVRSSSRSASTGDRISQPWPVNPIEPPRGVSADRRASARRHCCPRSRRSQRSGRDRCMDVLDARPDGAVPFECLIQVDHHAVAIDEHRRIGEPDDVPWLFRSIA